MRVTPSTASAQGTAVTKACPEAIVIEPLLPLETYSLAVEALAGDGTVVGTTTCTARTEPGLTSSATCAPLR